MKYLKSYENLKNPQRFDYVIVNMWENPNKDLMYFVNNNIGHALYSSSGSEFTIKYENVPNNLKKHFIKYGHDFFKTFHRNEIIHFSKNKEYLQITLDSNKFNL